MSPKENEEIRKQVQELLDKGLIRESLSPCAVPTVLAPKKGGEWRMCTDSRAINKITISKTKEEHFRQVRYVLEKLQQDKLLINFKKCSFFQKELVYLGFVIAENELKMDLEKVAAILSWPSPQILFEVRSFHGLASFYRKFIKNFSGICAPMLDTIKKASQPFQWTKGAEKSFQILKKKSTERPILRLLDFNKLFQVRCDASGTAIRAVLSQEDKPVAYFSKKLNESRKKYTLMTRRFMPSSKP
eukprot:PITA_18209